MVRRGQFASRRSPLVTLASSDPRRVLFIPREVQPDRRATPIFYRTASPRWPRYRRCMGSSIERGNGAPTTLRLGQLSQQTRDV